MLGKLPFDPPFCSAVIARDGTVHVSGCIGCEAASGKPSIVPGGPEVEAEKTMQVIDAMLRACGARTEDITMVHAFLVDYTPERFAAMNKGYMKFWGDRPLPARICTGATKVGMGGNVEFDAVAKL